jgi:hypothetical protein
VEDRINYFERMLADNPENPTGLLALANEYQKAGRYEDEAAVLRRYLATHERERGTRIARTETPGRLISMSVDHKDRTRVPAEMSGEEHAPRRLEDAPGGPRVSFVGHA